jgi:lipopolysaccharide export system protein LptA
MALQISLLRRWVAVTATAFLLVLAGYYFYARRNVQNALKQVPDKIGIEIQQTAQGFSVSKSEQGRTLFKMEASKAVQFKDGGRTELHDVRITVYGRDSSRYDQLYGSDFEYDPHSGDAVAQGEVQIDLNANPGGATQPDQSAPEQLKDAIHLKTSGLVFNQKTGNAYTKELIEFGLPQGSGSARGLRYDAKDNDLALESQVHIVLDDANHTTLLAEHASIRKDPRVILLDAPHLQSAGRNLTAATASIYLRPDNTIEKLHAEGGVNFENQSGQTASRLRADQLDLMADSSGDQLRLADFSGDVSFSTSGAQPIEGSAGRLLVRFGAHNQASSLHAEQNVKLTQIASGSGSPVNQSPTRSSRQNDETELTASAVDATLAGGDRVEHAETEGAAQIAIRTASSASGGQTLVTAGKFVAKFDDAGQLTNLHGAPEARIVSQNASQIPNQPERVSTSETVDAAFHRGLSSIVQNGNVVFTDGQRKAFAQSAHYFQDDQTVTLTGSPRITDTGMATTAQTLRFNRVTGDAFAEGDVKTTYTGLKPQPTGALLASSSPIHVTAQTMIAHQTSATALYSGDVRLWQDANVVQAPTIEFNRDLRSVNAESTNQKLVSTVLFQPGAHGQFVPIAITSKRLQYVDSQREAEFLGGVKAVADDLTLTANEINAFLDPRGTESQAAAAQEINMQKSSDSSPGLGGKLNRIVAEGSVVITQPGRKATGNQLVYTVADDKFELTGGPPSIFDAEHGKVTGVSLTLYRHDDRVLVKGDSANPAVSETRVAR